MSSARSGQHWPMRSDAPAMGRGLLASVLLHGLLLTLGFSGLLSRSLPKAPQPLPLQVALLAPAAPVPAAPVHRHIEPSMQGAPRPAAKPLVAAARPVPLSMPPAPAASAPAAPASSGATAVDSHSVAVAAAPAPATPTADAPAQPRPGGQASLDGYAQTLSALLARQRSYPQLAALRGWEGEVRLSLRIARRGALLDVQVTRSSGYEVLDRNALQLVQQVSPLPAPPEGFEGSEIQISVPIQYKLKKNS